VDPSKVEASYKKGVLKVVLKKTKESEAKKIEVR
jgi:HSP20 family molecular chaperone IbpA